MWLKNFATFLLFGNDMISCYISIEYRIPDTLASIISPQNEPTNSGKFSYDNLPPYISPFVPFGIVPLHRQWVFIS